MKLAISNIAWDKENNKKVYYLMNKYGFTGLEIAPTKIFNDIYNISNKEVDNFIKEIDNFGLKLVSMQSLTFGKPELQLFETPENFKKYLTILINLASKLGIKSLIFGSPKNRIFKNISKNETIQKAKLFFEDIGNIAFEKGVNICIEPNPDIYGGNFLLNTFETLEFIKLVNNPGIKLHLDLGTIIANNEDIEKMEGIEKYITHFHISEPYLEIIKNRKEHKEIMKILKNYNSYYSIEIKGTSLENIEKTMILVSNIYK